MEDLLATAEKKALVEIVKLVQKRGLKGSKGDWKEFLNSYDKKFGASLSDPARRSNDILVAFLKTFDKEDQLEFLAKVIQSYSKRNLVQQFTKSPENESPVQRLVRLTLEHPQYPLEYAFPSNDKDWVVTKLGKKSKVMRSDRILAVDCEMVLCVDGTEALVRVCVVNHDLQVKLDELVNPNKAVADYRTEITGITAADLEGVTCSLADVQKSMMKLLNGKILAGHSLSNDLNALKIDHAWVIDTSFIFRYSDGPINRRPSLNNLCKSLLGYEVRKRGAPHNCLDDACAAMKLVLARIEHKINDTVPLTEGDVPEIEMSKLLVHRIPKYIPSEELLKVIPGDFTIEIKPTSKGTRDKYSAFAIFKNSEEAQQAYENVEGRQEKDSCGRPQKLVTFQLSTGQTCGLYVRKMAYGDCSNEDLSKKRAAQVEVMSKVSKKLKSDEKIQDETQAEENERSDNLEQIKRSKQEVEQDLDQCPDHLKEIERLKQELKSRDVEISRLTKKVSKYRKDKKGKKERSSGVA